MRQIQKHFACKMIGIGSKANCGYPLYKSKMVCTTECAGKGNHERKNENKRRRPHRKRKDRGGNCSAAAGTDTGAAGTCIDSSASPHAGNGQVIVAVEPQAGDGPLQIRAIQTPDGKNWWMVFTSFEEEVKGGGSVMSTFLTDMGQLFQEAGKAEGIHGVIFNPWNRTLMLDQQLIRIVLGESAGRQQ